jgi:hypothetical protein
MDARWPCGGGCGGASPARAWDVCRGGGTCLPAPGVGQALLATGPPDRLDRAAPGVTLLHSGRCIGAAAQVRGRAAEGPARRAGGVGTPRRDLYAGVRPWFCLWQRAFAAPRPPLRRHSGMRPWRVRRTAHRRGAGGAARESGRTGRAPGAVTQAVRNGGLVMRRVGCSARERWGTALPERPRRTSAGGGHATVCKLRIFW